jgi:hypothetical protein
VSTVRVITTGAIYDQDYVASDYAMPHPDGAVPIQAMVQGCYMANGTAAELPPLTMATREGRLAIEAVTSAEGLVNQGSGTAELMPAVTYKVVTNRADFSQGAVPSVNASQYAKALSVDDGMFVIHGPLVSGPFGSGEGAPVMTFFSTGPDGDIEIPATKLELGRSNQRSSFAGQ